MPRSDDYCSGLAAFIRLGDTESLHTLFRAPIDAAIAALYRNGYFRSCREVLAGTFPSILRELGDDAFAAVAGAYAHHHAPGHGSLTGYGEHFIEWLGSRVSRERR